MRERDVTTEDILFVLLWGEVIEVKKDIEHQNWKCVVKGQDLDGEELTFLAGMNTDENSILCITVY